MVIEKFKELLREANNQKDLDILIKSYRKVWCMYTEQTFLNYMNNLVIDPESVSYQIYLENFKNEVLGWLEIESGEIGKIAREGLGLKPLTEIKISEEDKIIFTKK